MSYKINKPYIKEYSQEVSKLICDEVFQQHTHVDGKQLVNLTEIRQLNLFLVKKMYLRWQEEGAALHSPYFNYSAPEVRQTFNKLMNVLSKNISISRGDFEPFLASSLKETLYFLIDPLSYFEVLYDGFNGKIFVAKDAQKIDSFQENRNLLLSEDGKVNTKPQLEIFADDVRCSHGATIGHLNDDEVFYLHSRGLTEQKSRELLVYAFALESVESMEVESVEKLLLDEVIKYTTRD